VYLLIRDDGDPDPEEVAEVQAPDEDRDDPPDDVQGEPTQGSAPEDSAAGGTQEGADAAPEDVYRSLETAIADGDCDRALELTSDLYWTGAQADADPPRQACESRVALSDGAPEAAPDIQEDFAGDTWVVLRISWPGTDRAPEKCDLDNDGSSGWRVSWCEQD
jgi:hypothetical protein